MTFSAFSAPSAPSDTVTVCQAMCDPMDYDFWECTAKGGKLSPVGSRHFKINVADQTVFEERDAPFGPYKFNSCKVMDRENWSCPYNDKSGEIGMGKGAYYESYGNSALARTRTVKATGQVPCAASAGYFVRDMIGSLWFFKK